MLPFSPSSEIAPSRPGPAEPPTLPAAYFAEPADPEDGNGLIEYWRILSRRKGTVILAAFVGLLVGLLVTLPQTPVYQAAATIEIQTLNDNFLNTKVVSPYEEGGPSAQLNEIQTQIKLIQSRTLIDRTLRKLDAASPRDSTGGARVSGWRQALHLSPPPGPQVENWRDASGNLKIRASGQTRVVEIAYDSPDAQRAANFVNVLVQEYIDQNLEARWQLSKNTGQWLSRQLDEMRAKLQDSEDRLQAYASRTGLLFTDERYSIAEEKLRQVQAELSKVQADRMFRQSRYELAKSSPPESLADILNDSNLREYQLKLADLRRQQAELAVPFKTEHTKVRRLAAEIGSLEHALTGERANILKRISNDYEEALRREKLLADDYALQVRLVTDQGGKSVQYKLLKREVDSNRQIYDAMLQRAKESAIASASRASNVRVVDAAEAPLLPYKPSVPLNCALGLLAGAFLGVGYAVIRERADHSLRQPGEAQFYLNTPELGVIPSAAPRSRGVRSRSLNPNARPRVLDVTVESPKPAGTLPDCVELETWRRKLSPTADAFRAAVTSVLFCGENGSRPRVLVVTSAGPTEGKSTVTSNLGIALAENHDRVLIIDADLRKPSMHEIFGVNNETGLADLLAASAPAEPVDAERVSALVQETGVPNLYLLPSGRPSSVAATFQYSREFLQILAVLRKKFEMILIDTPPALQLPDARMVGRLADAVILVARAGHASRDAAVAARRRFSDDNTNVLGVILNDWDPRSAPGGYEGYYKA